MGLNATEGTNMETNDYCPICAESIVFEIPELEHCCIDADQLESSEFEVPESEASSPKARTFGRVADDAVVKLRGIWSKQLATREDRVVHGHSEGDLAHHLLPIVSHMHSK
jgi:hypothetical protein